MAAAHPQLVVAQRTLFQVSDEYVRSAEMAWTASLQLQGPTYRRQANFTLPVKQ